MRRVQLWVSGLLSWGGESAADLIPHGLAAGGGMVVWTEDYACERCACLLEFDDAGIERVDAPAGDDFYSSALEAPSPRLGRRA